MGPVEWRLALSAFCIILLAELGDKTQMVVFSLASRYCAPLPIFVGASLALTVLTLASVVAGRAVLSVVPVYYIQIGSGLMFIGIGIGILWRVFSDILFR